MGAAGAAEGLGEEAEGALAAAAEPSSTFTFDS